MGLPAPLASQKFSGGLALSWALRWNSKKKVRRCMSPSWIEEDNCLRFHCWLTMAGGFPHGLFLMPGLRSGALCPLYLSNVGQRKTCYNSRPPAAIVRRWRTLGSTLNLFYWSADAVHSSLPRRWAGHANLLPPPRPPFPIKRGLEHGKGRARTRHRCRVSCPVTRRRLTTLCTDMADEV